MLLKVKSGRAKIEAKSKYVPHNTVNHFHDNFIDDMEEVNDDATFFPQGSKNRAESQAKENDTQGVGTIPVSQGLTIVRILGVGLQAKPINNSFYFREWFIWCVYTVWKEAKKRLSGNRFRPKSMKLSTISTFRSSVFPFPKMVLVSALPGCTAKTKTRPMTAEINEVTKK